jgi:hypothetical protein
MVEIVKVDTVPSVAKPVEGVDYNVIAGAPAQGDKVRIRDGSLEHFQSCYSIPPIYTPQPKMLSWVICGPGS